MVRKALARQRSGTHGTLASHHSLGAIFCHRDSPVIAEGDGAKLPLASTPPRSVSKGFVVEAASGSGESVAGSLAFVKGGTCPIYENCVA